MSVTSDGEPAKCQSLDQPCDEPIFRNGLCFKHVERACKAMGEPSDPVEAALVKCARALAFSLAGSERPPDGEPEQQALWDAMATAYDALGVIDTREYRPALIRLQDVTDRALLVELQRRLVVKPT